MEIKCAIATPETDAEISQRERTKGAQARADGLPITACPWQGGMCEFWWKEGYQDQHCMLVAEPL